LHAVGALFSLLAAAGLGMAGLQGMLKASLGSIPYRVAFALSAAAISLVSGAFVLLFFVLVLGMIPGSFRLPGAISSGISLAAGFGTLLALGGGLLLFAGYSYVAGLLGFLLVFRSDEQILKHSWIRGLDRSDAGPWDVPADAFPLTPPPPAKPAPSRPPPPPPQPLPVALCGCPVGAAWVHQLKHTEELARSVFTLPTSDESVVGRYSQVRRCRACGTLWWGDVTERDHKTYDRNDEYGPPLAVIRDADGHAVRVLDQAHADALTEWAPRLWAAYDRYRRAQRDRRMSWGPAEEAERQASTAAFVPVAMERPETDAILPLDWRDALKPSRP
jgi:hypothetical protein